MSKNYNLSPEKFMLDELIRFKNYREHGLTTCDVLPETKKILDEYGLVEEFVLFMHAFYVRDNVYRKAEKEWKKHEKKKHKCEKQEGYVEI